MKVYVLLDDYEIPDQQTFAVYSTWQKANTAIQKMIYQEEEGADFNPNRMMIYEKEIDEEPGF